MPQYMLLSARLGVLYSGNHRGWSFSDTLPEDHAIEGGTQSAAIDRCVVGGICITTDKVQRVEGFSIQGWAAEPYIQDVDAV